MTRSFDLLFDRSPLPSECRDGMARIRAGDQKFIDQLRANASKDRDDDGPPFFGVTPWVGSFKNGHGKAGFTILYSPAMDLSAVARSITAGCILRQRLATEGKLNSDGTLPPVFSVIGSSDWLWRLQDDVSKVIEEVPAFLKPCQPAMLAPKKKKGGKRRAKGGGKRRKKGMGKSKRRPTLKPELVPRAPVAEGRVPLLGDRQRIEDMIRIALPLATARLFDYSTLEERSPKHLEPAPMFRDTDRIWRIRLKTGQWVYVVLFEESEPDWLMGLRVTTNTALTWVDTIERGELGPRDLLPPVLPIVVYRGQDLWMSPTNIQNLISASLGKEGSAQQEYILVDMLGAARLAERGVVLPPGTVTRVTMMALNKKGKAATFPVRATVPGGMPKLA